MVCFRARELRESGGGRPGPPVPDGPYGLCERKATTSLNCIGGVEFGKKTKKNSLRSLSVSHRRGWRIGKGGRVGGAGAGARAPAYTPSDLDRVVSLVYRLVVPYPAVSRGCDLRPGTGCRWLCPP